MLDIQYIRDNKEQVIEAAKNKNREFDIDMLLAQDDERRKLIQKVQELRAERNKLSKSGSIEEIRERGRQIKVELKELEDDLRSVEEKFTELMLYVPNVPLDEVPVGSDESANVQTKVWGDVPTFNFTPKSHIELSEMHDLLDMEAGAEVSGFRGYFLKNQLAQLHFGLLFYVFQKLVGKGYMPIIAPSVVKEFTLFGSAHFPWGRAEDVYSLNDDDMFLAGTAEIPVMGMHANKIYKEDELPLKYVAFSPCFRREAGSYGKDTQGLYRVHEFWKIEQVIIANNNLDQARVLHEELQRNSEEILQELELPYHVLLMSTGDMGEPQMIKYDTEVWMPSREGYGETMSNSIMGDFQCRRLNIKYKDENGDTQYAYSLNNTAIASPRILIPLLENHQQENGSIKIPQALQPIVGFDTIES